jgi:ADP-dependent NAD(P)H-hydrate dehydratase / NAD(P)H-hydrate epimerase
LKEKTTEKPKLNRILKGSRVAEIDSMAISDGIDSLELMNNAGEGISRKIFQDYKDSGLKRSPRGLVVCGGGNNGGDGFVAALGLLEFGYNIKTFHIVPSGKLSKDSSHYYKRLIEKADDTVIALDLKDNKSRKKFFNELAVADFILDAILGTGFHDAEIRGEAREIIDLINSERDKRRDIVIYSVDIPSGVDSDNGNVPDIAVRADKTITFGCKKVGNINFPGAGYNGRISIIDIGIPGKYYCQYEQIFEPEFEWVAEKIPQRQPWTYKHNVGKLLIIAGSIGYTGAAVMTCLGALRSGAGLVTLACPESLNPVFEQKLTETMTFPVAETGSGSLHFDSLGDILDLSKDADAMVIGPGISTEASTMHLVRELLKKAGIPVVLDADGLQALCGPHDIKEEGNDKIPEMIITPHPGELSSIMGIEKIKLEERIGINEEASQKFGAVSVLKGARTVISGGATYINPTGNWGMASAGTGDILAGIIGSLACQGMNLLEAAVCGTYIHGLSADIISKKTSKTSLIATDLLEGLKEVFLNIERIKYTKEI